MFFYWPEGLKIELPLVIRVNKSLFFCFFLPMISIPVGSRRSLLISNLPFVRERIKLFHFFVRIFHKTADRFLNVGIVRQWKIFFCVDRQFWARFRSFGILHYWNKHFGIYGEIGVNNSIRFFEPKGNVFWWKRLHLLINLLLMTRRSLNWIVKDISDQLKCFIFCF
jgi:hypothetical protein